MKRESASVRLPEQWTDVDQLRSALAGQRHYTPGELGELWHLAPSKIRELFTDEPGVLRIGEPSRREGRQLKRSYFTLRISGERGRAGSRSAYVVQLSATRLA